MTNSYTWAVTDLPCLDTYKGQQNVVFSITWKLTGTDGVATSSWAGSTPVTYNQSDPFTPFAQITPDQAMAWLMDALGSDGQASAKAQVDALIVAAEAPAVVNFPLPWAS